MYCFTTEAYLAIQTKTWPSQKENFNRYCFSYQNNNATLDDLLMRNT